MTQNAKIMGWKKECEEWQEIADEMTRAIEKAHQKHGLEFTVHPLVMSAVSCEQRYRMETRGQRPMTYVEIEAEWVTEIGIETESDRP